MRGKGSEDSGGVKYTRITPAYAGKSLSQAEIPEWG